MKVMRTGISGPRWLLAALLCWSLAAGLCWHCGLALWHPLGGLYAQPAGEEGEAEASATQKISQTKVSLQAEYGFENFNRDRLQVQYRAPQAAYQSYRAGFGYSRTELGAIDAWHDAARQKALRQANASHLSQAQFDASLEALQAERDRKVREHLAARGFKLRPGNTIEADVPGLVRRSAAPLKSVALAFDR
ncbi:MAG: hypothetical protein WC881_11440, partial [Elusimicrobiota bacterium]